MSNKNKKVSTNKETPSNFLIEYLRQVYMANQGVGIELFNLNQKLLETDEKKSNKG